MHQKSWQIGQTADLPGFAVRLSAFNTIVPLTTTTREMSCMGIKSLRYFCYVLKHKPGKLLAGFTAPAIIPKTTANHPFLNQFARAKYKLVYFAVPFDFLGVLAVVAKNLIIIFKAVRTNSMVQAILRTYVNWRSYPRAIALRTWYVRCPGTSFSGQYIDYCCNIYSNVWYFCPESFFKIVLEYQYIRAPI